MMKRESMNKNKTNIASLPSGSLNRATILLNAIASGSRKGMSLSKLVSRTGLPRPTIHRVLNTLMSLGWVERNEQTSRFNLGMDLAALGYSAMSRHPVERVASTELATLANKINQVVYLGIRSGLDIVCIGRYESESDIQVGKGWVGMRGPFGMTPACLGMFACMPKEEVDEIIKLNMSRYHRIEGFDEKRFYETLAKSIKAGSGVYDNILLDRTTSGLGVAICDPAGYPVAGIGTTYITGMLDKTQQQHHLELMQQAAVNISKRLFIADETQ